MWKVSCWQGIKKRVISLCKVELSRVSKEVGNNMLLEGWAWLITLCISAVMHSILMEPFGEKQCDTRWVPFHVSFKHVLKLRHYSRLVIAVFDLSLICFIVTIFRPRSSFHSHQQQLFMHVMWAGLPPSKVYYPGFQLALGSLNC